MRLTWSPVVLGPLHRIQIRSPRQRSHRDGSISSRLIRKACLATVGVTVMLEQHSSHWPSGVLDSLGDVNLVSDAQNSTRRTSKGILTEDRLVGKLVIHSSVAGQQAI